jgi:hypothetical protein
LSEPLNSNAQQPVESSDAGERSPRATDPRLARFRLATLTRIAGEALADMGIDHLETRLLEPIARSIHELGAPDQEEDHG